MGRRLSFVVAAMPSRRDLVRMTDEEVDAFLHERQTMNIATFGPDHSIQLLAYTLSAFNVSPFILHPSSFILLYWQSTAPPAADYTLFIHMRAVDGFVRSQADGPPVSSHYPTTAWQSGETIQDIHPLSATDLAQTDHLAIGLYDPLTGQRLPAFDAAGQRLSDDALLIPLKQK